MSKLTTEEVRAFENRLKIGLSFDENELDLTAYGELTTAQTILLEDYFHLQVLLELWQDYDDLVAKAKTEVRRLQDEKERLQGGSKFEKVSEWARWATGKVASNAQIAEIEQTQVEQRKLLTALEGNTFSDTTISSQMNQLMLTVEMLEHSLPVDYSPPVEVVSDDESEAAAEDILEAEIDEQQAQQLSFNLESLEVVDVDAELARQTQQAQLAQTSDSLRASPERTVIAREELVREESPLINNQQQQAATPSDTDELFGELLEETKSSRSGSVSPMESSTSNHSLASGATDLGELIVDEQQRRSPSPTNPEIIRPVASLASSPAKKLDETAAVEALVHQMVEQVLDEVDSPLVEEKSKVLDLQALQQDLPEQRGSSELLESNGEPQQAKMVAVKLSESLLEVEPGPVVTALMAEVTRLQAKADMSMGWSLSALWHGNYQAKAQAVNAAITALKGEAEILTDQQVIDAVNDSSSALYQALNQHSSYLFQMTVNTPSGDWTAPQARALLNIHQAIELQQSAEETASATL